MECGKKRQEIIVVMSKRRLYAGEWLIRAPAILSLPLSYIQIFLDAAMQIGIFIGCILSNRSLLTFREGTFFFLHLSWTSTFCGYYQDAWLNMCFLHKMRFWSLGWIWICRTSLDLHAYKGNSGRKKNKMPSYQ